MNFIKRFKLEILVALFFILVRLPSLGHDNFNTDVWKWKSRSYDFSTGIFTFQPEKTLQKYHPGVTLMWVGTFAIKISNLISDYNLNLSELKKIFLLDSIQKYLLVALLSVGFANIFYVLKKILNTRIALFAISLLALEPFYLAITRVFHLEGLLSTFMLASVLWLYYFLQDYGMKKRLFISALFCGLALLTKTSAVFLLLFTGLVFLHQLYIRSPSDRKYKIEFAWFTKWLLTSFLVCVVLWPALLSAPAQVYQELVHGVIDIGVDTDHAQFYFGKFVNDPGYFYFIVVLALKSSAYMFLGLVGTLFIYKKIDKSQRHFVNYLMVFVFFYFLQISLPAKKLDRYIMPAFVALSLVSSLFWYWLLGEIKFTKKYLLILFYAPLVINLAQVHPDYFSYFNPIFGGLHTGIKVLEPKWLIGEREILAYFKNKQTLEKFDPSGGDESFEEVIYGGENKKTLSVGFQEKYYTQIWPFFREINSWAVIQDLTPFAVKTRYFVYPVWDDRSKEENRFKLKYLDDIKIRGVTAYRVYERII